LTDINVAAGAACCPHIAKGSQIMPLRDTLEPAHTLVLGIGNVLLSDDGVGVHVLRALEAMQEKGQIHSAVALRDGGTIGLTLLSDIQEHGALIVIDATEFGSEPGTVRAFTGEDMDRQVRGQKRTAHEVALGDLLAAAQLTECTPKRRALIAIQPGSTQWGLAPSDSVRAAIPPACTAVRSLLEEWSGAS
jgi:hydrogenase maturation protease